MLSVTVNTCVLTRSSCRLGVDALSASRGAHLDTPGERHDGERSPRHTGDNNLSVDTMAVVVGRVTW